MPISARNYLGAPSAQVEGHFPAREAGGIPFRAGKDAFFCPELPQSTFCAGQGHFPAREEVGIPFRAGKDTFFCPELPQSTFRAG